MSGHWSTGDLYFLSPKVSFYKGHPIPVFVLTAGEMWLMVLPLSVKTQVRGRIPKKCVCVCASLEPGADRAYWNCLCLRLKYTLQLLENRLTILTAQWREFAHFTCQTVCVHLPLHSLLSVCGILWKGNVPLKRKKGWNRIKKNVGRKETFIHKFLGICPIWDLRMLWKRRISQGHKRHTKRSRFLLAIAVPEQLSVVKASSYCYSFWAAVCSFLKISASSQSVSSHQLITWNNLLEALH